MTMKFVSIIAVLLAVSYVEATGKCQAEVDRIEAFLIANTSPDGQRPVGAVKPTCLPDGTYHPVQCKYGRCECYGSEGNVLTKNPIPGRNAADMDCKCLRAQDDYSKLGIIGKMFSCAENGNYEAVQCTGSMCFCADSDGNQVGESTHISNINSITC